MSGKSDEGADFCLGYGDFDDDYLASAMASVEATLPELDDLFGGIFFRQNAAKAIAQVRRELLYAAYRSDPVSNDSRSSPHSQPDA